MGLRLPLLIVVLIATLATAATVQAVGQPALNPTTWVDASGHESGSAVEKGYAIQQRGYYSITAHFHTRGLIPQHRYTLWWVIYNNPSACNGECDIEDVITVLGTHQNTAQIGVLYGGTFTARAGGEFLGSTQIWEHRVAGCQNAPDLWRLCNGMADVTVAQAAVLINDNGPASDVARVNGKDMFVNGCSAYVHDGKAVMDFGQDGFACYTAQTVHLP